MTVNEAYDILNLRHNATSEELVVAYRRLVKVFHPDYNSAREAWSTEKMTRLNIAYETARAFIESEGPSRRGEARSAARASAQRAGQRAAAQQAPHHSRYSDSSEPKHAPRSTPHAEAPARAGRNVEPTMSPHFARQFEAPWQMVVDGLYVFYQYGLENVHLRREGVRRFRYRQAVRGLKDGLSRLEPLSGETVTDLDAMRLKVAQDFSRAFLQNMLIEKYYIPTHHRHEVKAYNHYNTGSAYLDIAIKTRFCGDLTESREKRAAAGTLGLVQHELLTVIAKYTESTWVPESMIKMHLLDRFNAVVKAELSA
ncbi:MAG: J domain-containing protein [Spirochaetota bacterium]